MLQVRRIQKEHRHTLSTEDKPVIEVSDHAVA